ncbi:MAG: RluA family pseudouridine synthase [Lachnospiraceae bacterium]|nr:RluA family pseudouridine synthase [Lachnospiraceae bacterium]
MERTAVEYEYLELTVPESYEGRKLVSFLKSELKFSQKKISSVKFDPGGLRLNGRETNAGQQLTAGDKLSVRLWDSANRSENILPSAIPLKILYEDEYYIAVNKPAGMVCHPSKGHILDSLANGLRGHFDRTCPRARVHLIGRLDKDTSGVVLAAKNSVAADILIQEKIRKVYLAAASGVFEKTEGTIRIPIRERRDPETGILKTERDPSGKYAETFYEVLLQKEEFALLRVCPETGRMHQIRFHMAETGHPLLGDPLYGKLSRFIGRTALHAGELTFIHPFSGEQLKLTAELPEDMEILKKEVVER